LAIAQEMVDEVMPTVGSLKCAIDYLSDKYGYKHYDDTPGWEERYKGLAAEIRNDNKSAIAHFKEAFALNPKNEMVMRHIEWLTKSPSITTQSISRPVIKPVRPDKPDKSKKLNETKDIKKDKDGPSPFG
jgi:hypothetical protein